MAKRPHTELHCAKDGPWITLNAGTRHLTFSLRHLVRELMPAQPAERRHVMADWLRERQTEGKEVPIDPPAGKMGGRPRRT